MMMRRALLAIVAIALPASSCLGGVKIGVVGDSYSDEYQFYSPHRNAARSWVELLAAPGRADFGEFRASSRGEPRNQGYATNWARSGATSDDVIASGQHTGLASQAAAGEVEIAVVFVGGNDVIEALHAPDPRSALPGRGRRAAQNVGRVVSTLLDASPSLKVVVTTVPDVRDLPEFRDPLRSGALPRELADRATAEIDAFNAEVRAIAASASSGRRVAVFDLARITRIGRAISPRVVIVAGRHVDRERPGDGPDHFFLEDSRHLGTIGQGLLAKLLVDCLNARFGAGIRPLEDREIAAFAESVAPGLPSIATVHGSPGTGRD